MSTQVQPAVERMVFRKTNKKAGRNLAVTPENSTMRHLAYGRIILDPPRHPRHFRMATASTGLICLSGQAKVKTENQELEMGQYDGIYIHATQKSKSPPRSRADFAEFSSDVENRYPLQVVRYAEISKDPGLKFSTGAPGSARHLSMILAKNVQAGRLVAGFTHSEPGNWTSWPPHEHAKMLEELYVYFDMPDPAYGIQLVYNNNAVSRTCDRSPRRRCCADARRLSSECFRTWTPHRFFVGYGRTP